MSSSYDISLLYVEDEKEIIDRLKLYLNNSFKEIFVADEEQEGMELFLKYKYKIDIMVSDIDKLLRRPNIYRFNQSCLYNFSSKNILNGDKVIKLNNQEIALLEYLIKNRGTIISYEMLIYVISNNSDSSIETLRTVIKRLRAKIEKSIIETISKVGYRLSIKIK